MNTHGKIWIRAAGRMSAAKVVLFEEFSWLRNFQIVAYQFGPKAVAEFCHRIARQRLSNSYHLEAKTPFFRGVNLTKKGKAKLLLKEN